MLYDRELELIFLYSQAAQKKTETGNLSSVNRHKVWLRLAVGSYDILGSGWKYLIGISVQISRKNTKWPTTPPKFNIAPEKWWLEDEFPFGIASF